MSELVTLDEAKAHLKIDHTGEDNDIQARLDAAEEWVIGYCDEREEPWTDQTVPYRVKSAILLMLGDLYAFRETAAPNPTPHVESANSIDALLYGYRTPTLA